MVESNRLKSCFESHSGGGTTKSTDSGGAYGTTKSASPHDSQSTHDSPTILCESKAPVDVDPEKGSYSGQNNGKDTEVSHFDGMGHDVDDCRSSRRSSRTFETAFEAGAKDSQQGFLKDAEGVLAGTITKIVNRSSPSGSCGTDADASCDASIANDLGNSASKGDSSGNESAKDNETHSANDIKSGMEEHDKKDATRKIAAAGNDSESPQIAGACVEATGSTSQAVHNGGVKRGVRSCLHHDEWRNGRSHHVWFPSPFGKTPDQEKKREKKKRASRAMNNSSSFRKVLQSSTISNKESGGPDDIRNSHFGEIPTLTAERLSSKHAARRQPRHLAQLGQRRESKGKTGVSTSNSASNMRRIQSDGCFSIARKRGQPVSEALRGNLVTQDVENANDGSVANTNATQGSSSTSVSPIIVMTGDDVFSSPEPQHEPKNVTTPVILRGNSSFKAKSGGSSNSRSNCFSDSTNSPSPEGKKLFHKKATIHRTPAKKRNTNSSLQDINWSDSSSSGTRILSRMSCPHLLHSSNTSSEDEQPASKRSSERSPFKKRLEKLSPHDAIENPKGTSQTSLEQNLSAPEKPEEGLLVSSPDLVASRSLLVYEDDQEYGKIVHESLSSINQLMALVSVDTTCEYQVDSCSMVGTQVQNSNSAVSAECSAKVSEEVGEKAKLSQQNLARLSELSWRNCISNMSGPQGAQSFSKRSAQEGASSDTESRKVSSEMARNGVNVNKDSKSQSQESPIVKDSKGDSKKGRLSSGEPEAHQVCCNINTTGGSSSDKGRAVFVRKSQLVNGAASPDRAAHDMMLLVPRTLSSCDAGRQLKYGEEDSANLHGYPTCQGSQESSQSSAEKKVASPEVESSGVTQQRHDFASTRLSYAADDALLRTPVYGTPLVSADSTSNYLDKYDVGSRPDEEKRHLVFSSNKKQTSPPDSLHKMRTDGVQNNAHDIGRGSFASQFSRANSQFSQPSKMAPLLSPSVVINDSLGKQEGSGQKKRKTRTPGDMSVSSGSKPLRVCKGSPQSSGNSPNVNTSSELNSSVTIGSSKSKKGMSTANTVSTAAISTMSAVIIKLCPIQM